MKEEDASNNTTPLSTNMGLLSLTSQSMSMSGESLLLLEGKERTGSLIKTTSLDQMLVRYLLDNGPNMVKACGQGIDGHYDPTALVTSFESHFHPMLETVKALNRTAQVKAALDKEKEILKKSIEQEARVKHIEWIDSVQGYLEARTQWARIREQLNYARQDLQLAHDSLRDQGTRLEAHRLMLKTSLSLTSDVVSLQTLEIVEQANIALADKDLLKATRLLLKVDRDCLHIVIQQNRQSMSSENVSISQPFNYKEWVLNTLQTIERQCLNMTQDWMVLVSPLSSRQEQESAINYSNLTGSMYDQQRVFDLGARVMTATPVTNMALVTLIQEMIDVVPVQDLLKTRFILDKLELVETRAKEEIDETLSKQGLTSPLVQFDNLLFDGRLKQGQLLSQAAPLINTDQDTVLIGDWLGMVITHLLVNHRLSITIPLQNAHQKHAVNTWPMLQLALCSLVTQCLHRCHYPTTLAKLRDQLILLHAICSGPLSLESSGILDCLCALHYGHAEMQKAEQGRRIRELVLGGNTPLIASSITSRLLSIITEHRQAAKDFLSGTEAPASIDYSILVDEDDLGSLTVDDGMDALKVALIGSIGMQDMARVTQIADDLLQSDLHNEALISPTLSAFDVLDRLQTEENVISPLPLSLRQDLISATKERIKRLLEEVTGLRYSPLAIREICSMVDKVKVGSLFRPFVEQTANELMTRLLLSTPTIMDETYLAKLAADFGVVPGMTVVSFAEHGVESTPSTLFLGIHQMLRLLTLAKSVHDILDPSIRTKHYAKINLSTLCALIRKIRLAKEPSRQQALDDLLLLLQQT